MARILIVEDDASSMDLALRIVRLARHEPITTMDGETAFAVAQATHPQLILLDLHIPRLSMATRSRALCAERRGAKTCGWSLSRRPRHHRIVSARSPRGAMDSSRSRITRSSSAP